MAVGDIPEVDAPLPSRIPRLRRGERVRYVPDNKSFGAFMRSDQMRDVTADVCEDIADLAGEYAPRRKSGRPPEGTAMADQFKVNRQAGFLKVGGNVRVKVEVFNSAPSAAPNEFGSQMESGEVDDEGQPIMQQRNERHRMLGRAGAAFGDFKPDGGV